MGQHFLIDQNIAKAIVDALLGNGKRCSPPTSVLEVGPGMGVLTQYLLERPEINLFAVEIDNEAITYLHQHFPQLTDRLLQEDFLKMDLRSRFGKALHIIGNFPYNISSQIFFKILEHRDLIPEVVCMIQKEVADRIAERPGTKTYGILSVFLQTWYDIEYLFPVGPESFTPPPSVMSAVIRLRRNNRQSIACDEAFFKTVVKLAFNQRRKTLRNSLKTLITEKSMPSTDPIFDLRPERLGVEDFVNLTNMLSTEKQK